MKLHPFQEKIVEECLSKKRGGLSLPMGSGKTIISLNVVLAQKQDDRPILIICSKTLVSSWEQEIKKWYKNLSFKTLHLEDKISSDIDIFISTPSTLIKYYKQYEIQKKLKAKQRYVPFGPETCYYNEVVKPFLEINKDTFYSVFFSSLIVDEAHNYINIQTLTCESIISICASSKWLLSGTLFAEPKAQNIFGFLRMCDFYKDFPDNLPGFKKQLNRDFRGLQNNIVIRKDNEMFIDRPIINKNVVKYEMNEFELKIYQIYNKIIKHIYNKILFCKSIKDIDSIKQLNAGLLVMITKLRLCMISPVIPISKLYIDNIDIIDSSGLHKSIKKTFEENNITEYLENTENLCSTRMKKIIEKINNHNEERILIFSSFRISLNYMKMIMSTYGIKRKIFTLDPSMSLCVREKTIMDYSSTDAAILLLTYGIGCEGLNLQSSTVVIISDIWWNEAKSRQAISRVYRYGQKNKTSVYMFISNTYIEYVMFEKHDGKASLAEEILYGDVKTKVKTISMKKIVEILSKENFHRDDIIIKSL